MVLPNKRSAMFLRKYLKQYATHTTFQPRIITITSFTQENCDTQLAEPLELLFILYNAYLNVKKDFPNSGEVMAFDAFAHWGNVLLQDFNEIDAYMADTEQLFKNIEDEREIRSYFLTPAQRKAAEALGLSTELAADDRKGFWAHISKGNSTETKKQFVHRWQLLGPIYQEFKRLLAAHRLAYTGQQSQEAYKRFKEVGSEYFRDKRLAFIGFNVLSTSRQLIFMRLQELGVADFFWDSAFAHHTLSGNKAAETVLALEKAMPAPEDFNLEPITQYPEIHIYPIPSNVAQAKMASNIIQGLPNPASVETGVILPSQNLLVPLLYSLPDKVNLINVAMKVPYSNTPFSTLIDAIISLQERARKVHGEYCYYFKDVLEVLSHPYLPMIARQECMTVKQWIAEAHLYNVPATELCQKASKIEYIFHHVDNAKSTEGAYAYLKTLFQQMSLALNAKATADPSEEKKRVTPYELTILEAYGNHVEKICNLARSHSIEMGKVTFFALLRRLFNNEYIRINGEPVEGMQIMGLEESRVLDFDTLLILSLNERIFPKRSFNPSYIPPSLRLGYGLPTSEQEDQSITYHFYRLISRAKQLFIIYDSRTPDLSSGEVSRFVTQMQMLLPPDAYIVHELELGLSMGDRRELNVEKTATVMEELNEYVAGKGNRNLSASSLKTYISCPLRFYLEKVKRLSLEDFDPEYMDAASYGTVMHTLAQNHYERLSKKYHSTFLSPETLYEEAHAPGLEKQLEKEARAIMNTLYYRGRHDVEDPEAFFPGEGRVLARLMAQYMLKMLDCEAKQTGFKFLHAEYKGEQEKYQWDFAPNRPELPAINFTMAIDRIDELMEPAGTLRLIDYKTGSDESTAGSLENLTQVPEKGAIFQLFTYSLAYHDLIDGTVGLQPRIYSFTLLGKYGLPYITVDKQPVYNLCDDRGNGMSMLEEFRGLFTELIGEIFDPKTPFSQTDEEEHCKWCPFIEICGRKKIE